MSREARKGQNESWFREINERLENKALERWRTSRTFEIVCECAREECTERITISFEDYERLRLDPRTFGIVPGHIDLESERLFETGSFDVVEKFGAAGEVADAEDPREIRS